ncbi:MAG: hypothetical protein IJS56_02490 [Bacilli bacterium]|nr:hypothetical protein [Bacilli bacterium]
MEKEDKVLKEEKGLSFTKKIVLFLLINAELQIWASYILAYFDKVAIAEALSTQVVITVLGAFITYGVKSLFENLSKYSKAFNPVDFNPSGDIITDENYTEDAESYNLSDVMNEFNDDYRDYDDNVV